MLISNPKYKKDTISKVVQILSDKLGISSTRISYKASFSHDLNVDSLDLLECIAAIEDEFKIKIPDEEIEKLLSVGDLIDCVDHLVHK
jgi:acyl carrier protein